MFFKKKLNIYFLKVIYVLRIHVDEKETIAHICSASEFLIPFSILSFGIVDAGIRHCKANSFGMDQGEFLETWLIFKRLDFRLN